MVEGLQNPPVLDIELNRLMIGQAQQGRAAVGGQRQRQYFCRSAPEAERFSVVQIPEDDILGAGGGGKMAIR